MLPITLKQLRNLIKVTRSIVTSKEAKHVDTTKERDLLRSWIAFGLDRYGVKL